MMIYTRYHFNPRSREGSDLLHASPNPYNMGFQSTLPRGERPKLIFSFSIILNFNPRSREGSDFYESRANRFTRISIHAPARGATFTLLLQIINYSYFNPRSREGSDAILPPFLLYSSNFNPRSREGSDPHDCLRPHAQSISIHAPARGATSELSTYCTNFFISIHAPARGATRKRQYQNSHMCNFNPRSREGSDKIFCGCWHKF